MGDLCMNALENVFEACKSPCSPECCRALGLPIRHGCDPEWANAYAHFVLAKRNVPCQRSCPIKPMCFLFGGDSPCFDSACSDLFMGGSLTRACHDKITRYCDESGIKSDDCVAYSKSVDKCGSQSTTWAECAAVLHSTNHFLVELKHVRDSHRKIMDVSKHATDWHSKFGFGATPTEIDRRCVLRFASASSTRIVPCAFSVSVTPNDLVPVVYFDSVLSVIIFGVSLGVFWWLRKS